MGEGRFRRAGKALYPNARNMRFYNCRIYGRVTNAYEGHYRPVLNLASSTNAWFDAINNTDNVRFINTNFNEEYTDPVTEESRYFSPTPEEVVDDGFGNLIPDPGFLRTPEDRHHWMVELSHASKLYFEKCTLNTNFTNKIILLSSERSLFSYSDYNYFTSNCVFRNAGLNSWDCSIDVYSINQAIFGLGDSKIWPHNWRRNLNPTCLNNTTLFYTGSADNFTFYSGLGIPFPIPLGGRLIQYGGAQNEYDDLHFKYFNPPISNEVTDFYWSPCKTEHVVCSPPLRTKKPNEVVNADVQQSLNIFPNPAHNQIEINNLVTGHPLHIEDMYGKICKTTQSMNSKMVIDVQDLNSGIYIIRCMNRKAIKFIKQ